MPEEEDIVAQGECPGRPRQPDQGRLFRYGEIDAGGVVTASPEEIVAEDKGVRIRDIEIRKGIAHVAWPAVFASFGGFGQRLQRTGRVVELVDNVVLAVEGENQRGLPARRQRITAVRGQLQKNSRAVIRCFELPYFLFGIALFGDIVRNQEKEFAVGAGDEVAGASASVEVVFGVEAFLAEVEPAFLALQIHGVQGVLGQNIKAAANEGEAGIARLQGYVKGTEQRAGFSVENSQTIAAGDQDKLGIAEQVFKVC